MTQSRPLSSLCQGQKAKVVSLAGGHAFRQRVLGMGLRVGRDIEVIGGAGRGGPVVVAAGDTRLAVGQGMAEKIMVVVETE